MKTSELKDAALDWAVAKCWGVSLGPRGFVVYYHDGEPAMWQPTTDWAQGGPIIEREQISTTYDRHWVYDPTDPEDNGERWYAELSYPIEYRSYGEYGATPLIAAMRCYVTSKLGDNIELPKELTA